MTTPATVEHSQGVTQATLRYLRLDPQQVEVRALVAVANRYHLDPLVGEIQLISTRNGPKVYVSRDGMIAIAHRSGQLDGITVDEARRNSTNNGWTCYVSVWRKDMSHPFTYGAQCKDTEAQAKAGNGPEMALARAERRALRRAFAIPSDETFDPEDEPQTDAPALPDTVEQTAVGPMPEPTQGTSEGSAADDDAKGAALASTPLASSPSEHVVEPIKPPQLAKLKARLRAINASPVAASAVLRSMYDADGLGELSAAQATDFYAQLTDEHNDTYKHLRNSGVVDV
jgi:hypothetical protein